MVESCVNLREEPPPGVAKEPSRDPDTCEDEAL